MTQERLNGLAMVAIENNLLEDIKMEELTDKFISNNARRILCLSSNILTFVIIYVFFQKIFIFLYFHFFQILSLEQALQK
ncbi:hypothetical protein LINPERHAP2_LOCUS383 [Linum perenne]